jgi:hypothetical protein
LGLEEWLKSQSSEESTPNEIINESMNNYQWSLIIGGKIAHGPALEGESFIFAN